MLFLIRATLAGSLIGATMTAGIALAAMDAVPNFNVEPSCQAAAQQAASADYVTVCRNSERRAHDEIARQWPQTTTADKAPSGPAATAGGQPTYTEPLACLQPAPDVTNRPGHSPPPHAPRG